MTKLEQIEILSRICDTAPMISNDRNDLCAVIKEMSNEPEPQFVTAYNLDKIISEKGNWRLCYLHNRYGNNTLLLLPSFEIDESEEEKVKAIIDMNDSTFEECCVIDGYIRSCPNTPFVIREDGFINCIETLTDRLSKLIDEDGFAKFNEEASKFLDFLKVCRIIQNEDEGFAYVVSEEGWQKFVPKKPKKFDSNYKLLDELYKNPYFPNQLLDCIRVNFTSVIHEIEIGETDIDAIKWAFRIFVTNAISMIDSLNHPNMKDICIEFIAKDIEYILSWFNINIDVKDIMKMRDNDKWDYFIIDPSLPLVDKIYRYIVEQYGTDMSIDTLINYLNAYAEEEKWNGNSKK